MGALRAAEDISESVGERLLTPSSHPSARPNATTRRSRSTSQCRRFCKGRKRVLLTLATGTGKTVVAFQICWKLWFRAGTALAIPPPAHPLSRRSQHPCRSTRRTRFSRPSATPDTRSNRARSVKSREMYFAIYQAIAKDERRRALSEYPPDFFDLIIVDECHRAARATTAMARDSGVFRARFSARDDCDSSARDNRDTYRYFDNPLYITACGKASTTDSWLRTGFTALLPRSTRPAGARRQASLIVMAARFRTAFIGTQDFERLIALKARTEAIARHLTDFLKKPTALPRPSCFVWTRNTPRRCAAR